MQAFVKALQQTRQAYASGHITAYVENAYILNGLLFGDIYGDRQERFWNGRKVHTSNIVFSFVWCDYHIVTTTSDSTYVVTSWQSFDPSGKGFDSIWSAHPIFHLGERVDPVYVEHFDGSAFNEELDLWRKRNLEIPRVLEERRIPKASPESSESADIEDRDCSEIFRLASLHLNSEELERELARARKEFVASFRTEMMIEYSLQKPAPDLVTLISVGYLPGWQSVLVIDGTFSLSPRAKRLLADNLLETLDPQVLPDFLRDARFSTDLGV